MPEQLTNTERQEVDLLNLRYNTRRALGGYALFLRQAREAQERMHHADQVIEMVNEGLPEGVKVGTNSSFTPDNDDYDNGGYNTIYRPDETGKYIVAGKICTEGVTLPFLGDRLLRVDEGLVVINDELGLGLSAKEEVFIVDTNNDPSESTLGGSVDKRFRQSLLPLIEAVPTGGSEVFDCLYD